MSWDTRIPSEGQEGGGIWQGQEDASPPQSSVNPAVEGAVGPIQETGQHARVSGQTMSCLSQAAVPGAGCAPEDAPSAVSCPLSPLSLLPLLPNSGCNPSTSASGSALQGWEKGSLWVLKSTQDSPFSTVGISARQQLVTGSLHGCLHLKALDTRFPFVF